VHNDLLPADPSGEVFVPECQRAAGAAAVVDGVESERLQSTGAGAHGDAAGKRSQPGHPAVELEP
jgi:hypothetical protein